MREFSRDSTWDYPYISQRMLDRHLYKVLIRRY